MRDGNAGREGDEGAQRPLLAPTAGKLLVAVLVALVTFAGAGGFAATSDSRLALLVASYLFFPLRLYLSLRGAFRRTIQDFTVCRFPACDGVALALTVALSVVAYYVLGCAVHRLVTRGAVGRSKRS